MLTLRDSTGSENQSLAVGAVKLWLVVGGLYIWEFITTFDYEWNVIRGYQPYRWTIWIYSITRLATLIAVILNMITSNLTSPINCQAAVTVSWCFGILGIGPASLLIVLRIFAIWNRNKIVVAIAAGIWGTNAAIMIMGVIRIRAVWMPVASACVITNVESSRPSVISLFATDIILLLIMLAGLLRIRRHGGGSLGLGRLLWKQGIIWFTIATAAEVLQAVFFLLDLNDILDLMFSLPSIITITIAATRMYRSLANFASPPNTTQDSETPQRSNRLVSNARHPSVVHVPSNRLEVAVHTAYEEYPMSSMAPYVSSDAQLADKPHKINFDDDVEGCEGKRRSASVEAAV